MELGGRELQSVREDIKQMQKRQLEMRRDINKATMRTRESGLEIMNLKNVLSQREKELHQFTQSVVDTGHQYSILGGKIVKVETTRQTESTISKSVDQITRQSAENAYESAFSSAGPSSNNKSVIGTDYTGTFVEDTFNYNDMSMMGATKISKRNQAN